MKRVAGVDGCPGGWIAVIWGSRVEHRLCRGFQEILGLDASVIAVDMPIGFLTMDGPGGRRSEQSLRNILKGKTSSVFAAPARAVIIAHLKTHAEACRINRRHSDPPKSISRQSFNIMGKMIEVDGLITPELQNRVFETHPEASFAMMNGGRPIIENKKSREGHGLRLEALVSAGFPLNLLPLPDYRKRDVASDDLIDACACAWSARRILEGRSRRFPAEPNLDGKGLRMEINA